MLILSGVDAKLKTMLSEVGREIRLRCGGGRFAVKCFDNGTVRVVVHLVEDTAQHRAVAKSAVYERLSAAGVPCQIAA